MAFNIKNILYKLYQSPFYISSHKQRIKEAANYLKNKSKNKKSILLWTTHKTASTFIGKALKQITKNSDYKYYDYASSIWYLGDSLKIENPFKVESDCPFLFKDYGEIYGPLRTPFKIKGQENFNNIFFLRDPRDLLISGFYSKSMTHELPTHKLIRKNFLEERSRIFEQGIDFYCLEYVDKWIIPFFKSYQEIRDNCPGSKFLSYEDFLNSPSNFLRKLCKFMNIEIKEENIKVLTKKALKPFKKNTFSKNKKISHFRSGKNRQFEYEIKEKTLKEINEKLKDTLLYWGFNI